EREQRGGLVRHPPAKAPEEVPADRPDRARLGPIEADRVDEACDPPGRDPLHRRRRVGDGEETRGGGGGRPVLGAEGEDAGDEDAEGIARRARDLRQRGRAPARRRPAEPAEHGRDVYRLSWISASSFLARGRSFTVQSATKAAPRSVRPASG